MSDYSELKKYAEIAIKTHGESSLSKSLEVTDFYSRANPAAVLALIAENESLRGSCKAMGSDMGKLTRERNSFRSKAEHLKAKNEALRKDADRYRAIRPRCVNGDLQIAVQYYNLKTEFGVLVDGEQLDALLDGAIRENETSNAGHGHVVPRADGVRMRCGGPNMCKECHGDRMRKNGEVPARGEAPQ